MRLLKDKLFFTFLFFGIIYSLISLVNHYCFRTYALDLGAYTNALYDYIRLQWNDSGVFKEVPENLLADHFDLYLMAFALFSLVLKTYTLLVWQIVAILVGGYGVYRYFKTRTDIQVPLYLPFVMMLSFFLFYGIYSALSYDYHSNVVASMLVPYLFLFIREKKYLKSFFVLVLICIAKENLSLWMSFVLLGLIIERYKEMDTVKYLSVFLIFSGIYFFMITQVVMPLFSNDGKFLQFKYSVLGQDYVSAIYYILTHPIEACKILFINHTQHPNANYVKAELHVFVLLSGLWALFFKPSYMVMLIPIYFQKLFHDNYLMWGIDAHYSIEYAPILVIGAGESFLSIKNHKTQKILTYLFCILNLVCTIRLMDRTIMFTNKSRIRIYQSSHYQRDFKLDDVYNAIQL
ncbi:MAG: DUF2079 domain-containing protein, partial [Bacteroidia bacterium]|nr:DUF2079 domain-containing protein [Bacteroidia bacterium]